MYLQMEILIRGSIKRVDLTAGVNILGTIMLHILESGRTDLSTAKAIGQKEIRQKTQPGLHIKENISLIRNGDSERLSGLQEINIQENTLMMRGMEKV